MNIKGIDEIEVQALGFKYYSLSIYTYVESDMVLKAIFKNVDTNEYLYYNLNYIANETVVQGIIAFDGEIRTEIKNYIQIENPVDQDISLNFVTENKNVTS